MVAMERQMHVNQTEALGAFRSMLTAYQRIERNSW